MEFFQAVRNAGRSEKTSGHHGAATARQQQRNNTAIVSHNVILCELNSRNGRPPPPVSSWRRFFCRAPGCSTPQNILTVHSHLKRRQPTSPYADPLHPPPSRAANKHMSYHAPSGTAQIPSGQSSPIPFQPRSSPIHPIAFPPSAFLFIICILITHQLSRFLNLYFALASLASTAPYPISL